jgi:hypothetical protein
MKYGFTLAVLLAFVAGCDLSIEQDQVTQVRRPLGAVRSVDVQVGGAPAVGVVVERCAPQPGVFVDVQTIHAAPRCTPRPAVHVEAIHCEPDHHQSPHGGHH